MGFYSPTIVANYSRAGQVANHNFSVKEINEILNSF